MKMKITQATKNETKEQRFGFPGMFWGRLGASLLGDMLVGKFVIVTKKGKNGVVRSG